MEQMAIWRRMAAKWREVAEEVPSPALKQCYAERAACYERRLERADEAGRPAGGATGRT